MKAWVVGVAMIFGVAGGVSAQTAQQNAEAEQVKARQKIFVMEGVLERAVKVGIDTLRRQLSAVTADDMLLMTGDAPQARGFRLDGYGVFFDVGVPAVRPSIAWSLRTMNETAGVFTRDVQQMRAMIQNIPDPQLRAEMERAILRLQQQMGPMPPASTQARGTVTAQSVGPVPPGSAPALVVPDVLRNPDEAYTAAVKSALIDTMLENSASLIIASDEWLTVAARENAQGSPFIASDPSAVGTIVLRIKGSDLAAFQARRLTLDEVRKRVEVREF